MEVSFLGTGTSQGNPVIGCSCSVCKSSDPRDKRLRSSILVKTDKLQFVIDTGPDFRYQMIRENIKILDAVLFTHQHKDHIAGLDDVRPFNYRQKKAMNVYAENNVLEALRREYAYAFELSKYPGVPNIILNQIDENPFEINNITIQTIRLLHHKLPILGFRIGSFSYLTDASNISESEFEKLKGTKTLVVNALRHSPHISHFNLKQSLETIKKINPERTFLTHISHGLGTHRRINQLLPNNISAAYDKLKIQC